jgi:hypothetical protein
MIRVLEEEQCAELIVEQWREVLLKQPWAPQFRLRVRDHTGEI